MRNKVLRAFELYSEGGSIGKHLDTVGLSRRDFYRTKRNDHELSAIYLEIQEARADMMVDEAYELGSDTSLDPRAMRAMVEVRVKIAGMFDRKRFGDKIAVEHEIRPNLVAAIESGRSRAALPSRDLHPIIDVQAIDITPMLASSATDMQSEEGEIDPFS